MGIGLKGTAENRLLGLKVECEQKPKHRIDEREKSKYSSQSNRRGVGHVD
jgi:hypothetical protein